MNAPTTRRSKGAAAKRILRRIAPIAVSLTILGVLLSKIGLSAVGQAIRSADPKWLVYALVVSAVANLFLGADKWRRILNEMGCHVSLRESLFIRLGAAPVRFTAPAKAGELLKPLYLQKCHGLPFARGTSSLLLDKVLNLWGILAFFFAGLPFFGERVSPWVVGLSVAFVALPAVLWALRKSFYRLAARVHDRALHLLRDLLSAFELVRPSQRVFLTAYSILFQGTEVVTCYLVCRAIGIEPPIPFTKLMVFVPIMLVVSNIPITPSGLGTREATLVGLFPFYGYGTYADAAAVGLLVSLIEYIFPVLMGLPFLPAFLRRIT